MTWVGSGDAGARTYFNRLSCCSLRRDTNHDGAGPDIGDLVYLVNYMFNGGPAPAACP